MLSPNQIYNKIEELNEPYKCPQCGTMGKDREEKKFIAEIGECSSCDAVRGDVMEQQMDMAMEDRDINEL